MFKSNLTQNSVNQMLEVLSRFWGKYQRTYDVKRAHIESIKEVSHGWNIAHQTIYDLNWRRLDLDSIGKFRTLLEKWILGTPEPLMNLLKQHTSPQHHREIDEFFRQEKFAAAKGVSGQDSLRKKLNARKEVVVGEAFTFQLQPDTAKKLKVLSLYEEVSPAEWLAGAVPNIVDKNYSEWLEKQR